MVDRSSHEVSFVCPTFTVLVKCVVIVDFPIIVVFVARVWAQLETAHARVSDLQQQLQTALQDLEDTSSALAAVESEKSKLIEAAAERTKEVSHCFWSLKCFLFVLCLKYLLFGAAACSAS
jgi:hypothetical protein